MYIYMYIYYVGIYAYVLYVYILYIYMGVSKNNGTPKSSILIQFFSINHPFWGTPIFGNTHILHHGYTEYTK